jgi:hypothetical protein
MKMPLSEMPYRQKRLWLEVLLDIFLLAGFIAIIFLRPVAHNPASAFLLGSYVIPLLYDTLKLHTTEDTRTDERDAQIESRGFRGSANIMAAGIYYLILQSQANTAHVTTALLVLWLLARIFKNSVQLRIYAGHEAWWPDLIIERQRRRVERLRGK